MQSIIWLFFSGLCAVTAIMFYVALRRYWLMGRGKYRTRSFKVTKFVLGMLFFVLALAGAVCYGLQGRYLVWADSLNAYALWLFFATVALFMVSYYSLWKYAAEWGFYKVKRRLGIRIP